MLDDLQALFTGTLLTALGVALLSSAKLVTGGTVGLVFLLQHSTGLSFGLLFCAINLPFYLIAVKRRGWGFTGKTICSVLLLSAFVELMPFVLQFDSVHPVYAAVAGGLLTGVGMLILFRHNASLGGFNILCLHLQDKFGWPAGITQLILDSTVLLLSAFTLGLSSAAVSLIAAVILNLSLASNHRPGRYITA
jgi:uncharacterized membrane-anchored protein YitT (DUF2179 family)